MFRGVSHFHIHNIKYYSTYPKFEQQSVHYISKKKNGYKQVA